MPKITIGAGHYIKKSDGKLELVQRTRPAGENVGEVKSSNITEQPSAADLPASPADKPAAKKSDKNK